MAPADPTATVWTAAVAATLLAVGAVCGALAAPHATQLLSKRRNKSRNRLPTPDTVSTSDSTTTTPALGARSRRGNAPRTPLLQHPPTRRTTDQPRPRNTQNGVNTVSPDASFSALTPGASPGRRFATTAVGQQLDVVEGAEDIYSPEKSDTAGDDAGERLAETLYSRAEDEAKHASYVHRSITCNTCGESPIRGVRYKCGNCIDYDICADCATFDSHATNHLFVQIQIPIPPLMNPRTRMFDCIYPGTLDRASLDAEFEYDKYKSNPYFNYYELKALFDQYVSLLKSPEGISMQIFCQCLGPLSQTRNVITERFFAFFDRNNDGYIDFGEFSTALGVLVKGKPQERIKYAFEGYDFDKKGVISKSNLRVMLKAYFSLSMELVRDVVKGLELNIVDVYDEQSTNPVSSMFVAPIPTGTAEVLQEVRDANAASQNAASRTNSQHSTNSGHRSALSVNTFSAPQSNVTGPMSAMTPLDELRRAALLTPYRIIMDENLDIAQTAVMESRRSSPVVSGHSDKLPIVEALSLDAIDGIVEAIFEKKKALIIPNESAAERRDRQGKDTICFEEFVLLAEEESGLLSWFEALGIVF